MIMHYHHFHHFSAHLSVYGRFKVEAFMASRIAQRMPSYTSHYGRQEYHACVEAENK